MFKVLYPDVTLVQHLLVLAVFLVLYLLVGLITNAACIMTFSIMWFVS